MISLAHELFMSEHYTLTLSKSSFKVTKGALSAGEISLKVDRAFPSGGSRGDPGVHGNPPFCLNSN